MNTERPEENVVRSALEVLTVPNEGTVWIGTFEQLHGAGYSLLAATRHGIYDRDVCNYHARVRTKIIGLILEQDAADQIQDKSALDNALAGFYFNAAIQRTVWASERLIKTFVGISCACGRQPERQSTSRSFYKLLQDAKVRIEHLRLEDKNEMSQTDAMLAQFPEQEYRRETTLDSKLTLAMLRYDVNNRKHAIFSPLVRDRRTARRDCSVGATTWSTAPQNLQMQLASRAFEQVCVAYNEMRNWQPLVSHANL